MIALASGLLATTYGWGSHNCGDIGKPRPCEYGAVTASGITFDPDYPMAAVAAPTRMRMRPVFVRLRVEGGECRTILIADKMNPRYIHKRGFDLTPAAQALLTGEDPKPYWSARVYVCESEDYSQSWEQPLKVNYGVNDESI